MAIVTGKYVQSDGSALPAGVVPQVEAKPSKAFITVDGRSISMREQTVTPASDGSYTLQLTPTVDAVERGVHYLVRGSYLVPEGYGPGSGFARHDVFEDRIVVPAEGGNIGDLTVVRTESGLAWRGSTPPPMSMLWLYVHPTYDPGSSAPLPVYTAPDGTTVEHGELVEWSA